MHKQKRTVYIGLPKPYLSGTVIFGDSKECAGSVMVTLKDSTGRESTCLADFFGDFAFNDVPTGKESIRFDAQGYLRYTKEFEMSKDIEYLGEISLQKKKKQCGMKDGNPN